MIEEYREKCVACHDWIDFEDKDRILGVEEGICGVCTRKDYNLKEGVGRLYQNELEGINQRLKRGTHILVVYDCCDGCFRGVFTSVNASLKAVLAATHSPTDGWWPPTEAWLVYAPAGVSLPWDARKFSDFHIHGIRDGDKRRLDRGLTLLPLNVLER